MPTKTAQKLATKYLEKIELADFALKRPIECTATQKFHIMLIRALMSRDKLIIIATPIYLINTLKDIKVIINSMKILNEKSILILDTLSNEIHYEGCSCNIIK